MVPYLAPSGGLTFYISTRAEGKVISFVTVCVSVRWLQEIVTYVGLSCSELKVARSIAFLLTHAHLPTQVSQRVV